jgi:U3 small nucleolar RNA-associated protein 22
MYLAALSSHLSNHPGFATAQRQLVPFQGDPNRPALQLWLDATNIRSLLLQQKRGKVAAAAVEGLQGVILQLLPVVGLDAFDITKLAPDRNNVRRVAASSSSSKKKAAQNQQQQGQEQQEMLLPTPAYNAGVLQDMLLLLGSKKLQQAAAAAGPRFADAAVLLKVWAVQQGLACHNVLPAASYVCCSGGAAASGQATPSAACSAAAAGAVSEAQADGLSGHVLTVLLLLAVQQVGAAAAAAMSAVQQFRCALQLLTDKQAWSKATLSLPLDPEVPVQLQKQQQPAAAAQPGSVSKDHSRLVQKLQQQLQRLPPPAAAADVFRKQFDVTLLDSSGHLNLAVSVSSTALQLAQQAAQRAVEILNGQNLEPSLVIAALFSADRGLAGVFDYWWTVELPNESGGSSATASSSSSSMPGDQHPMR